MSAVPLVVGGLLALASVLLFRAGLRALRRERFFGVAVSLTGGALLLSAGALCATVTVATRGYRVFTREEVAAVVETRWTGPQSFNAYFSFPDGSRTTFSLAGDELFVDAHILAWKPLAHLLGLDPAFEFARVAGRYATPEDERSRPRTVFSLAQPKPVDLFELRRRFPLLRPLVEAMYDSATVVLAEDGGAYEIRVSASGLRTRRVQRRGGGE